MRTYVPTLAFLTLLVACAPTQRESTLKAALVTVDASRDGFLTYDASAQATIVTNATSLEQGKAALATYRAKRVKVETAFNVAYRAIAIASTLNDDPSIEGVKSAIVQVAQAVADIMGGSK